MCIRDSTSPTLTKRERAQYAKEQVLSTFRKVFPYILVGVAIGAVIHNWIPQTWIETVLGSRNPLGVVLATLVGVPMYADIFGTIPVAEALLYKGAQLGTILSFMMAVTTLKMCIRDRSGLSYHMKILCDSGIVVSRQEGKWTHYRLSPAGRDYAIAVSYTHLPRSPVWGGRRGLVLGGGNRRDSLRSGRWACRKYTADSC